MGAEFPSRPAEDAVEQAQAWSVGQHGIVAQQGERQAEFAGQKFQPAQTGDIGEPGRLTRIGTGKKPFFFHIQADNNGKA